MGAQQRVYKQRIRSTQTLKKMFRAMELIAASRIGRARDQATKASPYAIALTRATRSEEHTSELQSRGHLVCRLLLEKKKQKQDEYNATYTISKRDDSKRTSNT